MEGVHVHLLVREVSEEGFVDAVQVLDKLLGVLAGEELEGLPRRGDGDELVGGQADQRHIRDRLERAAEDPGRPQGRLASPLPCRHHLVLVGLPDVEHLAAPHEKHPRGLGDHARGEEDVPWRQRLHCDRVAAHVPEPRRVPLAVLGEERMRLEDRAVNLVGDLDAERLGEDPEQVDLRLGDVDLLLGHLVQGAPVHARGQPVRDAAVHQVAVQRGQLLGAVPRQELQPRQRGRDDRHGRDRAHEEHEQYPDGDCALQVVRGRDVAGAHELREAPVEARRVAVANGLLRQAGLVDPRDDAGALVIHRNAVPDARREVRDDDDDHHDLQNAQQDGDQLRAELVQHGPGHLRRVLGQALEAN
mmetsp:Transcript_67931/g.208132  ORF Transcript_67931/g.208132 Transcript_67931/m.208132 type:complete len:360 (-) Transcript_67931:1317-2396(-)